LLFQHDFAGCVGHNWIEKVKYSPISQWNVADCLLVTSIVQRSTSDTHT